MLDKKEITLLITENSLFKTLSKELKQEILPLVYIVLSDLYANNHPHFETFTTNPKQLERLIVKIRNRVTFQIKEHKEIDLKLITNVFITEENKISNLALFFDTLKQELINQNIDQLIN